MSLEKSSGLPFHDDFAVSTQIRIHAEGREYLAYLQTGGAKWHRFRIALRSHDIEELNCELQQAIEDVSVHFDPDGTRSEGWQKALSTLSRKGNFAFKRVFEEGTPREMISRALVTGATIQVSSEDFSIPWELLYDGPLGTQTDVSCFWGMQHIVCRAIIQDARPGDFVHPEIRSIRPRVGLIACNQLPYVINEEIPALKGFRRKKRIFLSFLRPLDSNERDKELARFGGFLRKKLQITHFACHAYAKEPPSQSYLLISDDFPITIEDFRVNEFEIQHNPFVILNACRTGTMNPLYTSNWASLFWERGARGVLATEFRVPDWFGAKFIKELYGQLLSGKPIGEALLASRVRFAKGESIPLGLAYALYSSPSIKITQ